MNFASDNTAGMAPEILDAIGQRQHRLCARLRQRRVDQAGRAAFRRDFRARGRGLSGADRHGGERARARASDAALGRGAVPCGVACRDRRMRRAGVLRRRHQAGRADRRGEQDRARRPCAPRSSRRNGAGRITSAPARCRSRRRPNAARSIASPRSRELAEIAHARGVAVHMDGARIGNALARMNVSPAELTWKAGVDVLSFGATKGGAMGAEAVIFFDPQARRQHAGPAQARRRDSPRSTASSRRRWRPISTDDLWLKLARHANAMADALAAGLTAAGCKPVWPVEANEVFAPLTHRGRQAAQGRGRDVLSVAEPAELSVRGQDPGAARDIVPDHRRTMSTRFLATMRA